uniref:Uncharacterized protein n=1 Tax=Lactuca sativa TaxID=4236 RepID=A0A9R1UC86_LACSA|nr:hypothetical protein LSAT_V11C900494040 [Lactuca sativa]
MGGRLTSVLTPYAHTQATKIPLEISSPFPSNIFQVFDFKTTCVVDLKRHTCSCYSNITKLDHMVQIYYRTDVFLNYIPDEG